MCGIVGIIHTDREPIANDLLERMTSALSHRGPDGQGTYIKGEVGFGHTRLSIIDLEHGQQPLSNEDGQVWVTFNGEIYNYVQLRQELISSGHHFRTRSDTETIVHAYEEWGDQCVEHFRGMFAFAIADWREKRVFLALDHLGIKPLYYLHLPNGFFFSSELQALKVIPDIQLDFDLQAIDQYLWLQYIPAPKTAFKQICKLSPAHRMSISFDGKINGPEEYWKLEFCPNYSRREKEWIEALDEVLKESVQAHLVSDVPFGAFLSGGVDSCAVVAYMSQILDRPVHTFSIGFEEKDYNELDFASHAAKICGTEHHFEIVRPDAFEILPRLVKHYGEPFGDSSALPTFYVSQMARKYVPMVLSGDGGDESFGGYNSYLSWMRWLEFEGIPSWKRRLYPLAQMLMPWRRYLRPPNLINWLYFINYLPREERIKLWREEYKALSDFPLNTFEKTFANARKYSPLSKVQYMDLKTYLPYDILTKVDRASMMHGLEVRIPFVDVKVIEFAATIPEYFHMGKNPQGQLEGKLLVKKTMSKYYSPEFLHRPKMGFAVPLAKWFGLGGSLRDELQRRLLGAGANVLEIFEPAAISSLIEKNSAGAIWLLLFLEEWLEQNK
ncbi:MAG: asparagine synthase (glutamine-hydrolyzing) [Desulfobacterales bacterium]|nr:asparagine synthase (glutamine-hydrolyzing) [Desulfobacterales bacterium]